MRALAAAIAIALAACKSPSPLQPVDATARLVANGGYTMTSVNACAPPCLVMMIPPESFYIQGGHIVLTSNGTFLEYAFGRVTSPFPFPGGTDAYDTTATTGVWSFNGTDALWFFPSASAPYRFDVAGNVIERTIVRGYGGNLVLRYELVAGPKGGVLPDPSVLMPLVPSG